jgi:hypothetical protein
LWLGQSAPRLWAAILARAPKIMAPPLCFTGQVHRLTDAPEAHGAMITRAKAAPAQSHSTARDAPLRSALAPESKRAQEVLREQGNPPGPAGKLACQKATLR